MSERLLEIVAERASFLYGAPPGSETKADAEASDG
jgi:hypothetical protein